MRALAPVICLMLMGPAAAQTTASVPGGARPEKLALADRLIQAQGGADQARKLVGSLFTSINSNLAHAFPQNQSEVALRMRARLQEAMLGLVPTMLDASRQVFAAQLSEQELRDMVTFAESASGRSIQAKLPAMLQQVTAREMPMLAKAMPELLTRAVEDACRESGCTPEQKQTALNAALGSLTQTRSPS